MDHLMSFLIGMIVMVLLIAVIPAGKLHRANQAIEKCELELPRNQTCVLTAKVKDDE